MRKVYKYTHTHSLSVCISCSDSFLCSYCLFLVLLRMAMQIYLIKSHQIKLKHLCRKHNRIIKSMFCRFENKSSITSVSHTHIHTMIGFVFLFLFPFSLRLVLDFILCFRVRKYMFMRWLSIVFFCDSNIYVFE